MKLFLILIIFSLRTYAQVEMVKVKVSDLHRKIEIEINKPGPSIKLQKNIVGDWYKTRERPQIYPGGCSEQEGYFTDLQDIKLTFDVPLQRAFSFNSRLDGIVYLDYAERRNGAGYGGYPAEYEGNTVKTNDGNCILTDLGGVKDAMICAVFKFNSVCGWYSVFLKN